MLPFRLLPEFGPGRRVVRVGVRLVVELVRENRVRRFVRDALRRHHVAVGMIGRHGGRRDHDLRAVRLQQPDFFLRHLVRHREDALVALERRGDGKRDAGVAARAFDDRAAGLQRSVALGLLDDRHADPVLHRAAGIVDLGLRPDRRADAARDAREPDQRRPAHRLEDGIVDSKVALGVCHARKSTPAPRRGRRRARRLGARFGRQLREQRERLERRQRVHVDVAQPLDHRMRQVAREQSELVAGVTRRARGDPGLAAQRRDDLFALEQLEQRARPRDHRLRKPGETPDFDAVRAVRAARLAAGAGTGCGRRSRARRRCSCEPTRTRRRAA